MKELYYMVIMVCLGIILGCSVTMALVDYKIEQNHLNNLAMMEKGINLCKNQYAQDIKIDSDNRQIIIFKEVEENETDIN